MSPPLIGLVALLAVASGAVVHGGRRAAATVSSPSAGGLSAGSAPGAAERIGQTRARDSGRRVEVVARRTETMEIYAEPGNYFTAELHAGPVRVRRNGDWVPVDTTLVRQPDGSVAPRAASVSLAFSGGGGQALVRLGRGDQRMALRWPARLPAVRGRDPCQDPGWAGHQPAHLRGHRGHRPR